MRYMTKAWYETMQKTDWGILTKTSVKAETFSEAFYRECYRKEEAACLELRRKANSLQGAPCDENEVRRDFRAYHRLKIRYWKNNLPKHILSSVADIRLFALGITSGKVKRMLLAQSQKYKRAVRAATESYQREYRENFGDHEPDFGKAHLHDSVVLSCRKKGQDIVIDLEPDLTNINHLIFKNCEIIRQDRRLYNAFWLYDEIYPADGGYEIHVLLDKTGRQDLIEWTVHAADIVCEEEEENAEDDS